MNKRGAVETVALYVLIASLSLIFAGTVKSGVAKKNGQTIWCKMQNKGADYCDSKYRPNLKYSDLNRRYN